ncbi:MAG: diguanylate cyclase [Nakamurella sp.]
MRHETRVRAAPWVVLLGVALLISVATFSAARVSLEFFKLPGAPGAIWWPATGLVLVIVVRCPRRWWWVLLPVFGVVTGIANIPLGGLTVSLTSALVNVLEVLVAGMILQGSSDRGVRKLRNAQEAVRFVVAIAAALAVGAALVALRSAVFQGDAPWDRVARGYVAMHMLGLFSFAPLLLPGRSSWKTGPVREVEFVAVLGATVAIDAWAFLDTTAGGRAFPILLPIIWAAIRLDPLRATATSLITCALAAYGTSRGLGAFGQIVGLAQRQMTAQLLIATVTITTLALVLITRHRARLVARVSDSEQTLKVAIQQALVGIYSIRLDAGRLGEIRDVNTAMCQMLGYEPDELEGKPDRIFRGHPDSAESTALTARIDQLASGEIDAFQRETHFAMSTGDELWVELSAARVVPSTSPPFALIYVHDLTGREQIKHMLESMALHDALTGLPNRSVLFPRLDDLLQRAYRDGTQVGLLYLDLNGFKPVNDTYGHAAGDAVLVEVARRLENSVRPGDTVARLGGDEFAVLAANIGRESDLAVIAERIHAELATPIALPDGAAVTIDISIGAAVGSRETTADDLLRAADVEMYRIKSGGAGFRLISRMDPGLASSG